MTSNTLKFGFYSFMGIWLFLVPVAIGGESAMLLGHLKRYIVESSINIIKTMMTGFAVVTIVGTVLGMKKKTFNDKA